MNKYTAQRISDKQAFKREMKSLVNENSSEWNFTVLNDFHMLKNFHHNFAVG